MSRRRAMSGYRASGGGAWTPDDEAWTFRYSAENVISDANGVSQITDLSGNAYHATQTDNTLKSSVSTLGGRTVLSVNADAYDLPVITSTPSNYFFGAVISMQQNDYIMDTSSGRMVLGSSNPDFGYYDGGWKTTPLSSLGFSIVVWSLDDLNGGNVRVNGVEILSNSYTKLAISGTTRLFNRYAPLDGFGAMDGNFATFCCKITDHDSTLVSNFESWASDYYGITI